MNRKNKIDEISNLLSKGFYTIYEYIQNPQEFLEAESKDSVNSFFDNQVYLNDSTRQNLKTFYFVQSEISEKYMDRHRLVLCSGISDIEDYSFFVNKGIASVKEFLGVKLKEDNIPTRFKILNLVDSHVQIIEENIEALSCFIEKEDENSDSLLNAYNEENSIALSYEILKKINPSNDRFLDIEQNFSEDLLNFMTEDLVYELVHEYGKEEAKRIFSNLEERINYLTADPNNREHLAYLSLMINQILHHSEEYEMVFPLIFQLATLYKKSYLIEGEIDVLINLYQYIITKATDLNLSLINPNATIRHINLLNRNLRESLGDFYTRVWDKDKSIAIYKDSASYWNGDIQNIEKIILNIEETYDKIGLKTELLEFYIQIISNPTSYFEINEIVLSEDFVNILSMNLSFILSEYEFPPKFKNKIKDDIEKINMPFLDLLNSVIENDDMNFEKLEKFAASHYDELNKTLEKYDLKEDINLVVSNELNKLRIIEADYQTIADVLSNLKNEESLNRENQFVIKLFRAKLKFLNNDISCIEQYSTLFSQDFETAVPSIEEQNYWYREYLRALNLNIASNPTLDKDVYKYIKKKLDNAVIEFYENNGTRTALFIFQEQIEECVRCILESLEKSFDTDFLYQILWSILYFKNGIILWKSEKASIVNSQYFIELNDELKNQLSELYFYNNNAIKNNIEDSIFELRKLILPEIKENSYFKIINLPKNDTIIYYLFTKRDDEHLLLQLNFYVDRTPNFNIELKDFTIITTIISDVMEEESLRWEYENFTLLAQLPETNKQLYSTLISNHKADQILNNIFSDFGMIESDNINLMLDGLLYNLPFETLRFENTKSFGVSNRLTTLLNKERDNIYIRENSNLLIVSEVNELPNFIGLSETIIERNKIEELCTKKNIKFQSFYGTNATILNLRNYIANHNPNLIHISVHGIYDNDMPYETTCLILEPSDKDIRTSLLTYNDILGLDLTNLDLVVLSGCNTASGNILKGTPMLGLAYAFLAAGAKSILASKIEVQVENTATILNTFYNYLISNENSIQESFRKTLNDFYNKENFERAISSWTLYT